ncbi:uncharacterized protein Z518_07118 [Rhinocladiella mackenziei CBS 650.93]|uniref:Zn(2)-C6 fungal-type domain-containing protein n=1 Tax=Rhinocladiella mackenziei CBS 650.93 TaxID=1442369 RepID=A0A0D2J3M9_9EURO|nr:uncharacterized protein Z518_07118 [Rhinocladiella mackenziei CBS 650.93]KIX03565.1 hypothetical protein Z518_07118 [Rhinocladiella mackenziei CBS 650.93]
MIGPTRQKAFSHKVRTGCITCKRRRVKCDEGKPYCQTCLKGKRRCLGYAVPKANIFTVATQKKQANRPPSPPWPGVDGNPILLLAPRIHFGTQEENRSLEHWLLKTSPMLSHYGPMGDFYTAVVPRFAWQSPVIKHMLLSLSLTHEKFVRGVTLASADMTSRAVSHYIAAITAIRKTNPPILHVLIASLIAWTMEMMQNDFTAAEIHLQATLTLLRQYEPLQWRDGTQMLVQDSLKPTSMLAKGLTAIVLRKGPTTEEIQPDYRDHIYSPWTGLRLSSIPEARLVICDYIERIARITEGREKVDYTIDDVEILLSRWFDSVRKWDQESTTTANLTALVLLFNVGMALLPGSDVAGFSYAMNPNIIDYVVDRISLLLSLRDRIPSGEDKDDLLETVTLVLSFVIRFFPDARSHAQALRNLKQVSLLKAAFPIRSLTPKWPTSVLGVGYED